MSQKKLPSGFWLSQVGDLFVKLGLKCGGRVPPKPRKPRRRRLRDDFGRFKSLRRKSR